MKKNLFTPLLSAVLTAILLPGLAVHASHTDCNHIAIIHASSDEHDVNTHPQSLSKALIIQKNDDDHSSNSVFCELMDDYFLARERMLAPSGLPAKNGPRVSESVKKSSDLRYVGIKNFKHRLGINIVSAEVTYNLSDAGITTNDDGTFSAEVYERTSFDYRYPSSEAIDTSIFGTRHKLTFALGDSGAYIVSDEYDELDLFGVSTADIPPVHDENESAANIVEPRYVYYNEYDADAAAAYADKYWTNYNPAYANFSSNSGGGGDCANYVSQCLFAGGLPQVIGQVFGTDGWFYISSINRSATWTGAKQLRVWLAANRGKLVTSPTSNDIYTGSPIFYGDTHTVICVGRNSAGVPIIDSHTTDRYHFVWDYWQGSETRYTVQMTKTNGSTTDPVPNPAPTVEPELPVEPSPSPAPSYSTDPTVYSIPPEGVYLNSGTSSGEYVKWLQACLCQLGYLDSVTGQFGYETAAALRNFQAAYSLTVDGGFGPQCRSKLLSLMTLPAPSIMLTSVTGGARITLTATLGAQIYFTTDGFTPTTSSHQYSEAFALTLSVPLKAIATMPCRYTSAVSEASVDIYTVTFKEWNGDILKVEKVLKGASATPPSIQTLTWYDFIGWSGSYSNISADTVLTARYVARGDVNGDGSVNVFDAMLILRHVMGISLQSDPTKLDIDRNGSVGANDALMLLRRVLGII